jgi:hypothetical protein
MPCNPIKIPDDRHDHDDDFEVSTRERSVSNADQHHADQDLAQMLNVTPCLRNAKKHRVFDPLFSPSFKTGSISLRAQSSDDRQGRGNKKLVGCYTHWVVDKTRNRVLSLPDFLAESVYSDL